MLLRALELLARRGRRPGSHPAWMAASFALFLLRWHQRRVGQDAVVLREELHPGETLVISHTTHPQG